MMRAPGRDGVAFSDRSNGDLRGDSTAREVVAAELGIDEDWATVDQVHGSDVRHVSSPGNAGEADALWTTTPGLPLAIFTADCFGVVLTATDAVGVAHVGWRGAVAGVMDDLRREMSRAGHEPVDAAIGPGIGPCCFEVGPEVAALFDSDVMASTTWGTRSIDLPGVLTRRLDDLEVWTVEACTLHEEKWLSHRADRTSHRMATIGWLP